VAALYVAGVNGYALLAGGTFAGLVLGLAGQTVLSNVLAGILLILARPFEPGDRITLISSDYGLLMPSYPPKFYSNDFLAPGYTGTVRELGIIYTVVDLDEGPPARFPNSIVIQAMIVGHDLPDRWVRVRYELPPDRDPTPALGTIEEAVRSNSWVVDPRSVRVGIDQATSSSIMVRVDARCRGSFEEAPRSDIYLAILRALGPPGARTSAAAPPGPGPAAPTTVPPPPGMPGGPAEAGVVPGL
jgi:small conductance mechanosensitive channel